MKIEIVGVGSFNWAIIIIIIICTYSKTKMKSSLIALLVVVAIVSGQQSDQLRVARDIFHVVAATIHEYLSNPSGIPLEQRLQFALQMLLAAGSNITAASACQGIHLTASYVCNIAASGAPASIGTIGRPASSGSTGYRVGKINFPT